MKFATFAALFIIAQLALATQADAARIRLRWSKKNLSASLPRGGSRYLNVQKKMLKVRPACEPSQLLSVAAASARSRPPSDAAWSPQVCSGDVVNFYWSGETMGMFGFYSEAHYNSCNKSNLNFMKNIHGAGSFDTKANNSGYRYYAYIPNKGKGDCELKLKIYWDESC